jgi:hypothetical protein
MATAACIQSPTSNLDSAECCPTVYLRNCKCSCELHHAVAQRSECPCRGPLTHDAAGCDQGLPDWDEILERGDEEEKLERAQRRSRERKLQEEFAEKRVRVVDDLGRSYATGETI